LHHLEDDIRRSFVDDACRLSGRSKRSFPHISSTSNRSANQVPHLHCISSAPGRRSERLKAVWLALDRADATWPSATRLETGLFPRAEILARLRDRLRA